MNTAVISFRTYKNLKSWLAYAGNAFKSEGELLRLIVTKAAIKQATESKAGRLLDGLLGGKHESVGIGNTRVYAVRLPISIFELVRECAARWGKSPSEWCAVVLLDWYHGFHELYEEYRRGDNTWLIQFAGKYRALVEDLLTVYAQKHDKQAVAG
jgi:hypothetical protein